MPARIRTGTMPRVFTRMQRRCIMLCREIISRSSSFFSIEGLASIRGIPFTMQLLWAGRFTTSGLRLPTICVAEGLPDLQANQKGEPSTQRPQRTIAHWPRRDGGTEVKALISFNQSKCTEIKGNHGTSPVVLVFPQFRAFPPCLRASVANER